MVAIVAVIAIALAVTLNALRAGNNMNSTPSTVTRSTTCPTDISEDSKSRSLLSAESTSENPYTIRFSISSSHDDPANDLTSGIEVDFGDGACGHPFLFPVNCGPHGPCFGGAIIDHTYLAGGTYNARLLVTTSACDLQKEMTCFWESIARTTVIIEGQPSDK